MRVKTYLGAGLLALCGLMSTSVEANNDGRSPYVNYILKCSGCHGADGKGSLIGGIPAIPDNIGVMSSDRQGRLYLMHVPGIVASGLNDQDLARLMNWLNDKWGGGHNLKPYTAAEITHLRTLPLDDIVKYRRTLVKRYAAKGEQLAEYPWP